MIVAVPSARSSAGFAVGHRGVAAAGTRALERRGERRAFRRGVLAGEGVEPRGDRLWRGGLRRGVQHGDHGELYAARSAPLATRKPEQIT